VPLNGVPHPAMTTDCPSVNSWIPTVVKVATLLVSETLATGDANVVSKGKITASDVSIMSFK
jgi:hypothetical protein